VPKKRLSGGLGPPSTCLLSSVTNILAWGGSLGSWDYTAAPTLQFPSLYLTTEVRVNQILVHLYII
jgi:hypothetical protein